MGVVFAPTRFSLVRNSIRDLVADRKSLVRNSGVGGGGQNLIFIETLTNGVIRANRLRVPELNPLFANRVSGH